MQKYDGHAPRTRLESPARLETTPLGFDAFPARPLRPADGGIAVWGLSGRSLRGVRGAVSSVLASDRALATALGVALFVLSAWPLLLVTVPPYQDVPNHLAAATVLSNPSRYPEYVSNGFLKTNAALFVWLRLLGRPMGLAGAIRAFSFLVIFANALVLPHFVLSLTNRRRLVVASFFMWPMAHNWFVSMGMLDFALAVPLSLLTLMALERYRAAPSAPLLLAAIGLGAFTWYAHVFPLMVVLLLVGLRVVSRGTLRLCFAEARSLTLPVLPSAVLVAYSLGLHLTEPGGAFSGYVNVKRVLPAWELVYNLFAEWLYGFTWLSGSSIVVAVSLLIYGYRRRNAQRGFLSPLAFSLLLALYVFSPYSATNWFHVNSRFIPFLWLCALVRVPASISKRFAATLAVAAVAYSIGMGIDFVRLDAERVKFTAGIDAVPEGARLLPLVFRQKDTSENTRNLLHLWGLYVAEKHTSAPLLFAHSRSFPVMYREPPLPRFNEMVLEGFAPSMATSESTCRELQVAGAATDCEAVWRGRWDEFWKDAIPRFDHVLTWDATKEAEALIPAVYQPVFREDKLVVYARRPDLVALTPPPAIAR